MSGLIARAARRLWREQPPIASASGPVAHVSAPRGPEYFRRVVSADVIAAAAAARRRARAGAGR